VVMIKQKIKPLAKLFHLTSSKKADKNYNGNGCRGYRTK